MNQYKYGWQYWQAREREKRELAEDHVMAEILTEEQEAQLTHFIETAKEDIERYLDQGASLREALARVARAIHALSDRSGTHIV